MADPANYFFDFFFIKEQGDSIKSIENDLSLLDHDAWLVLKNKCVPFVVKNDTNNNRGWSQLINHLFEAKGYLFLKNAGYQKIFFIFSDKGIEAPDLKGFSKDSNALLEVKCINHSENFLNCLFHNKPINERIGVTGL